MLRSIHARALTGAMLALIASTPLASQYRADPRAAGEADGAVLAAAPAPVPVAREEHARRRAALAAAMEDGVLVAFGEGDDALDPQGFAQNASFRYLTGLTEPEAALVIAKAGGRVSERLFVLPRDPAREVWDGVRLGPERAQALTGIPARTVDSLLPVLHAHLGNTPTLYTLSPLAMDAPADGPLRRGAQIAQRAAAGRPGTRVVPLDEQMLRLRAAKSPAELDMLRRAIYITAVAQREAIRSIEPGMGEFEIQALIEYTFRRHGGDGRAFPSIVGSGPNSTTLHYRSNGRIMQAGETVVMDVGAGYRGYAADVTRTVPVGGRFTPEQRQVYEVVLAAQKATESLARPGVTLQTLNATAAQAVAGGLARLGLIDAPDATYDCRGTDGLAQCPQFRLFYMHSVSHGIGLNVHDPDVSYYGPLAPGSAISIEPGIYVRADAFDFLPDTERNRAFAARRRAALQRYRNIGVRIEDDYFVTPGGAERVSAGAPREVEEIEALMAEQGPGNRGRHPVVLDWYRQVSGSEAEP
ncbi:MAG TPA: Xaa-Pro aminopeptidase [Gemmatimonadales bacterium]|nr:Xaa-Pro aminopeptidase [Gemmatimonadales bacterium]